MSTTPLSDRLRFKPLARAFERADRDALRGLFAEGFEGRLPANAERIELETEYARVTRLERVAGAGQPLDAQRFVDWLLEWRSDFYGTPRVRIALTSMSPAKRDVPDGPWIAGFRMRVAGQHGPGRPEELYLYARIELVQPTRERLEQGNWLRRCSIEKVKSARSPRFLMREVAAEMGIDTAVLHDNWDHGPERMNLITGGVYLSDFNRDGIADVLINDFTTSDGYALYRGTTQGKLVNEADGRFTERRFADGPADFGSMGVTCGDVDNDGGIDVYVASMYSTAGNRVIGNLRPGVYPTELTQQLQRMVAGSQLYRNRGSLSFERLGDDYDVAQVGWAYGPSMVDLDNDGWLDLHVPAGFISRTRAKPDG